MGKIYWASKLPIVGIIVGIVCFWKTMDSLGKLIYSILKLGRSNGPSKQDHRRKSHLQYYTILVTIIIGMLPSTIQIDHKCSRCPHPVPSPKPMIEPTFSQKEIVEIFLQYYNPNFDEDSCKNHYLILTRSESVDDSNTVLGSAKVFSDSYFPKAIVNEAAFMHLKVALDTTLYTNHPYYNYDSLSAEFSVFIHDLDSLHAVRVYLENGDSSKFEDLYPDFMKTDFPLEIRIIAAEELAYYYAQKADKWMAMAYNNTAIGLSKNIHFQIGCIFSIQAALEISNNDHKDIL